MVLFGGAGWFGGLILAFGCDSSPGVAGCAGSARLFLGFGDGVEGGFLNFDAGFLADHNRGEGPRVALIRADYDTTDGFCEVQLSVDGRTGIGRAGSGPLIGGAEATLAALRASTISSEALGLRYFSMDAMAG